MNPSREVVARDLIVNEEAQRTLLDFCPLSTRFAPREDGAIDLSTFSSSSWRPHVHRRRSSARPAHRTVPGCATETKTEHENQTSPRVLASAGVEALDARAFGAAAIAHRQS